MHQLSHLLLAGGTTLAPHSAQQQLLDLDGTIFILFGLFLLLMFLLTKFYWNPYLNLKEQRTARIDGYKAEADSLEKSSATKLEECEAALGSARKEGSEALTASRRDAQAEDQKMMADAQAAAQVSLAQARAKIETAIAAEKATLTKRAQALGNEAAEKILGRNIAQ